MSFYDPPRINLSIKGTQVKGFSLLLPYYGYREQFLKLGIQFVSAPLEERYVQAKLPKNWSCVSAWTCEGTRVLLFNENAVLKAKVIYGLFVEVEFS